MSKNTLRFISIYFRSVYYTMEAEFQNIIALLKKKEGTKPVKTVIQKVNPVNSNVDNDDEDTQNLDQISKTKPNSNPGNFILFKVLNSCFQCYFKFFHIKCCLVTTVNHLFKKININICNWGWIVCRS